MSIAASSLFPTRSRAALGAVAVGIIMLQHGGQPAAADDARGLAVQVSGELVLPVGGLQQTAQVGGGARLAATMPLRQGLDAYVAVDYARLSPRDTIDEGFGYDLVAGSLGLRLARPGRVRPYLLALMYQQSLRLTSPGMQVSSDGGLGLKVGAGLAVDVSTRAALVADVTYAASGASMGELGAAMVCLGIEIAP